MRLGSSAPHGSRSGERSCAVDAIAYDRRTCPITVGGLPSVIGTQFSPRQRDVVHTRVFQQWPPCVPAMSRSRAALVHSSSVSSRAEQRSAPPQVHCVRARGVASLSLLLRRTRVVVSFFLKSLSSASLFLCPLRLCRLTSAGERATAAAAAAATATAAPATGARCRGRSGHRRAAPALSAGTRCCGRGPRGGGGGVDRRAGAVAGGRRACRLHSL